MSLYLVTGASGFIGRALCTHISARGHTVRALLRRDTIGPWQEAVVCDLSNTLPPDELMAGVYGVFHCAGAAHFRGLSKPAQSALWQLNVDATQSLFDLARRNSVQRWVYFSSVQAAGRPGDSPATEQWQSPPDNLYGESKLAAERLLLASDDAMHTCILRPTLVYGPGVKGNLARMLAAVAKGRMPPLPDSGKQRSMVALENLVDAAWAAMNQDVANRRTYIVCDDKPYSTRQLYESMYRCMNRPIPGFRLPLSLFRFGARVGDIGNRITDDAMPWDSPAYERLFGQAVYSAESIKSELGWRPRLDFDQALPAMVDALRDKR